ncbi:predicted nucleoside-diphosphate-sugar epimerases [Vibrio sp. JCM 19236]|nr:predicted nucleoside-diphosphate-sugar epimerases [Vibrio sp. JCM 19236]
MEGYSHQRATVLSLLFGMKGPGLGRLECTIIDHGDHRELDVRAWWHPKGFLGLLYWWAMFPAHLFIFKGMVRAICKKA